MSKTVLHIVEAPGGVERYLVTLLNKLQKYPEYEHILVCSDSVDIVKFSKYVKQTIVIHSMHNAINFVNDMKSVFSIRRIIKDIKPDIVYCHSSKAGAIGRMANFGVKNKLLYNPHGWSFNMKNSEKLKLTLYELIEKVLSPLADKIICISEYEQKSALGHHICKPDRLVIINNGINFDEYDGIQFKSRRDLGIPEEAFVVGTIGRLTAQKSPDVFVKMAVEIKKQIPKAFFLMVGDDIGNGKFRKETECLIRSFNIQDSFLITGWVDDPLSYLQCFDVATLLSRWEGFGLVLPEYMLMEKPIVVTKADAIPYVVGDAGLLVDIDDHMQAANSIVQVYTDSELRDKLIEKGKERVKLFNAQRTADQHLTLFNDELSKR